MRYEEFVRYVEAMAADGLGQEGAERAIAATLTTLARCLPGREARDLAAQLPPELQAHLAGGPARPQAITVGAFLQHVAEREDASPSQALHHVRAVMDALAEAVTGHELRRVRDRLPEEFETLFVPPAAAGWPQTHRHRPHP
jgi:uncharacterized protein (DUF2267 family)